MSALCLSKTIFYYFGYHSLFGNEHLWKLIKIDTMALISLKVSFCADGTVFLCCYIFVQYQMLCLSEKIIVYLNQSIACLTINKHGRSNTRTNVTVTGHKPAPIDHNRQASPGSAINNESCYHPVNVRLLRFRPGFTENCFFFQICPPPPPPPRTHTHHNFQLKYNTVRL